MLNVHVCQAWPAGSSSSPGRAGSGRPSDSGARAYSGVPLFAITFAYQYALCFGTRCWVW